MRRAEEDRSRHNIPQGIKTHNKSQVYLWICKMKKLQNLQFANDGHFFHERAFSFPMSCIKLAAEFRRHYINFHLPHFHFFCYHSTSSILFFIIVVLIPLGISSLFEQCGLCSAAPFAWVWLGEIPTHLQVYNADFEPRRSIS